MRSASFQKKKTYRFGVVKAGFWEAEGDENELLMVFQRLARYPGVELNDLTKLSGPENELPSFIEIADDRRFREESFGNDGSTVSSGASNFEVSIDIDPSRGSRAST